MKKNTKPGGSTRNGKWLATFCWGRSRWSLGVRASNPGKGRPLALRASRSCRQWTPIQVPTFHSEEEEATWWDTHKQEADDLINRAHQAGAVTHGTVAGPTARAAATKQTTLRLRTDDIRGAKRIALRKGLPYQTLLKMLIHEGLRREEKAS